MSKCGLLKLNQACPGVTKHLNIAQTDRKHRKALWVSNIFCGQKHWIVYLFISTTWNCSSHLIPQPYVRLTTSLLDGAFKHLLPKVVWMQWVGTRGGAAVKAGVGQHGGCCIFDWTCHTFPQSAAGEHLGLGGWCSEVTWVCCAGPPWHVGWLLDDNKASVRWREQQALLKFLHGLGWHGFWLGLPWRLLNCSCSGLFPKRDVLIYKHNDGKNCNNNWIWQIEFPHMSSK